MSLTPEEIENKLSAARTRLILDKPFLGALVLRLPLQAANPKWCPTTGTDARKFYYNPEYVEELKPEEAQFVLAHEALHCALSHFARRGHRLKHRWDIACDYAINPILQDEGLTPPPGSLIMREYRGMTAEEIYPLLDDSDMSETLDQHLYDKPDQQAEGGTEQQQNPLDQRHRKSQSGGEGQEESRNQQSSAGADPSPESKGDRQADNQNETPPKPGSPRHRQDAQEQPAQQSETGHRQTQTAEPPPLSEAEKDAMQVQWQQRLAGAAQQAQQAGKLGDGMARMIDFFLQPTMPWRMLLARFLNSVSRDDYSYTRPSSRRGDPAIYPSLRSAQMDVVVAVDVSGSIDADELNEFIAEIDSLKSQVRARVTLLTCDSSITGGSPWVFEAWEYCQLPDRVIGGGGTDFNPVFDWVERNDVRPDLLIYFTDAVGRFPKIEAAYPTVWLVKGKQPVPWGQRIQLN